MRVYLEMTVNIHHSSRHALHLLSFKITSPSMVETSRAAFVLESGDTPSEKVPSRIPRVQNGRRGGPGPHYGNG